MKKTLSVILIIVSTIVMVLSFAACGSNPQEQYYLIASELEKSEKLLSNYYANKYDMKDFNAAMQSAQLALDNSDEKAYKAVLAELQKQNKAFEAFIDERVKESYSLQTVKDNSTDYPFEVDVSVLSDNWQFKPLILQSSQNPVAILRLPAETTDSEPYMCLFIGSNSAKYDYEIENVDTRTITVQDENGELVSALVNTKVNITARKGFDYLDEVQFYSSNPAYFFKNKSGVILLAIPNREVGSDFYILYK